MEEKKIKLSLTATILIFLLAILVSFFGGIYFYKKIIQKQSITISNNNQVKENNKKVNLTLSEEEKNNLGNNETQESKIEINNILQEFSNEEIKTTIQEYLDLVGIYEGSPEGLLVKLGLTKYEEEKELVSENYRKTNIKYSDYKNKMLNYVTEEWFEKKFTTSYKNVNGYLYYNDVGASGIEWQVEEAYIKGAYSNSSYIAKTYNVHFDDSKELEYIEFHIENYNGKCVISYCDV